MAGPVVKQRKKAEDLGIYLDSLQTRLVGVGLPIIENKWVLILCKSRIQDRFNINNSPTSKKGFEV